jgi:hypothetical protein
LGVLLGCWAQPAASATRADQQGSADGEKGNGFINVSLYWAGWIGLEPY